MTLCSNAYPESSNDVHNHGPLSPSRRLGHDLDAVLERACVGPGVALPRGDGTSGAGRGTFFLKARQSTRRAAIALFLHHIV